MRTDLRFTHLTLVPGQPTRVSIEVTNTADVIDGVTAIIDGLDPDWIRLDQPLVRLFPEESGEVTFTLDVPPDCPAGDYLVVARIVSTLSADRQSVQDFWVTVEPSEAGRIDVVPRVVTKGAKAKLQAIVSNLGNTPTTFRLDAIDVTGEVDCKVDPPEVTVGSARAGRSARGAARATPMVRAGGQSLDRADGAQRRHRAHHHRHLQPEAAHLARHDDLPVAGCDHRPLGADVHLRDRVPAQPDASAQGGSHGVRRW